MPNFATLVSALSLAIASITTPAFDKPPKARALYGAIACKDPKIIEEALELIGQGDVVAWQSYLWLEFLAGKCEPLDEGEEFVVMGSKGRGTIISIRRWGSPERMYVLSVFLDIVPQE